MGYQRPSLDDEWQGLEPEQPKQRSGLVWAGIIGGVILLFVCLASLFVLLRQFNQRTSTPLPPPGMATSVVGAPGLGTPSVPTPLIVLTNTAVPASSTNLPAATVTLPILATATLPLAATVTVATVTVATIPPPTGSVQAAPLSSPPTINGDLSEWAGIGAYESTYRVFSAPGWNGTDDLTAVWRLGWDAANLYIAVAVSDDVHVQTQTGNQIFRGDSVDMQFETNLARASSQLGPSNFQITFSPGDFVGLAPSAFRFQGTSQGQILDAPGGHRITLAAQKTAVGYNLEAAIPWADLSITPFSGLVLGVSLNANDNDTPGTAVQEVMKSHVSTRTFTNPTTWGTLTLR
ncbi:MAG: hypothetical protein IPM39_08665 [Chloroflexi bacterium]|nr:hypothetical protein [Chloroflexota bacterium]